MVVHWDDFAESATMCFEHFMGRQHIFIELPKSTQLMLMLWIVYSKSVHDQRTLSLPENDLKPIPKFEHWPWNIRYFVSKQARAANTAHRHWYGKVPSGDQSMEISTPVCRLVPGCNSHQDIGLT
jgi:hypothetical protein